jgi:hypothetical protein
MSVPMTVDSSLYRCWGRDDVLSRPESLLHSTQWMTDIHV